MKLSTYNFFSYCDRDDVYIGFNTSSGGMFIFTPGQYEEAKKILSNPNENFDNHTLELKKMLIQGRFLLDDNVDELKLLRVRNRLFRFNQNILGLVIANTLECNYCCPYCYVDREKISMGSDVADRIKKYFIISLKKAETVEVCWTGGETLLNIDTIEKLNAFFLEYSTKKKRKFTASVISNGYLLTPKHLRRLQDCGISSIQITLDGNRELHNHFRYLKGGAGTYDVIKKNMIMASRAGMAITLRTNVSKDNYVSIYEMLDDLAASDINKDRVTFSPKRVMTSTHDCSSDDNSTFSTKEFAEIEPQLHQYALGRSLKTNLSMMRTTHSFCSANSISLNVLDPYANILKCWCNLGAVKDNKVGYIDETGNVAIDFPKYAEWIDYDPFSLPDCQNCKVLPLCMGGCIYYNLCGHTNEIEYGCTHLKYNINDMIKIYYYSKKVHGSQKKRDNIKMKKRRKHEGQSVTHSTY